jgi:hypothetical protein
VTDSYLWTHWRNARRAHLKRLKRAARNKKERTNEEASEEEESEDEDEGSSDDEASNEESADEQSDDESAAARRRALRRDARDLLNPAVNSQSAHHQRQEEEDAKEDHEEAAMSGVEDEPSSEQTSSDSKKRGRGSQRPRPIEVIEEDEGGVKEEPPVKRQKVEATIGQARAPHQAVDLHSALLLEYKREEEQLDHELTRKRAELYKRQLEKALEALKKQ